MSNYLEFKEIVDTMEAQNYDWRKEIRDIEQAQEKRKNKTEFSLAEHVKTMVYAMLSNNRPWERIAENSEKIDAIFQNFNINYLLTASPEELEQKLREIKCGNRQIKRQMLGLSENIKTLQQIATDCGTIDNYYNSTAIDVLIKSLSIPGQKYKLKGMGTPLVCEYLKGVGFDIIKPDVHVCRIVGRLGYSKHNPATLQEALDVCKAITDEYNLSQVAVDTVFWQYCAINKLEICTADPKCDCCGVKNCPSKIL